MIVVDTSVIIDALTRAGNERGSLHARLVQAGRLHAPHLMDYEVLNTVRGMTRGGIIEPARARQALLDLGRMPIVRHPLGSMTIDAWEWRHNLSAYDAAYVALAQRMDVPLWTRDVRLARACEAVVTVVVP